MGDIAIVPRDPAPSSDGSREIGIVGPITHATTPALRDYLRRVIDAEPDPPLRLRLDLSCCTNIDVDGMLALSVAQHAARCHGGDLQLLNVPPLIACQLR